MPSRFFVDGEAAISVASTIVPPRSSVPRASRCVGDGREHGFRQIMPFEQVPEVEDRRFVGDRVAAELQATERAHGLDVVERFLRAGIGQVVPLLQAIDAQHDSQRERPPTALRARLGIVRLDHALERGPRHHRSHLGQEHVTLRALLLRRKVERREAQLVHSLHPLESTAPLCHARGVDQRFLRMKRGARTAYWVIRQGFQADRLSM